MRHEQTMNRRLDVETIDKQYNNVKPKANTLK